MSDTTLRDRLGLIISAYRRNAEVAWDEDLRLADHLLNLGWRPPARVVSTVEEAEALAHTSIIRTARGEFVLLGKWYSRWTQANEICWYIFGTENDVYPLPEDFPATVLWEPEEGE